MSYDPAIPFLDIYPKELKPGAQRDICSPKFTAELFTIAKNWKQPKCLMMDKQNVVYTYKRILYKVQSFHLVMFPNVLELVICYITFS